jgi:sensor histidine kinase YesM
MKIRWRQYEVAFIIINFLILLVKEIDHLGARAAQSTQFEEQGVSFDPFWHQFMPFILSIGVPSILLLIVNLVLRKWDFSLRYLIVPVICWLILSVSFAIASYLRFYYLHKTWGESGLQDHVRLTGITDAGVVVLFYSIYFFIRETIIRWLNKEHPLRSFRIMVSNHAILILLLFALAIIFFVSRADGRAIIFVCIFFPSIIITLVNVYGIFPHIAKHNLSWRSASVRLAAVPVFFIAVAVLVFVMFIGAHQLQFFFIKFLVFGLLITPVSWVIFRFQRERLSSLLALEKDLGKKTADLQFLRSQINPHFLFNSLNTLYGLALREAAPDTAVGIQQLGDMMRFMLHENQRDYIPLKREVEYMRHYITLQEMRTAKVDGIRIETSIDESNCDHFIAPMLLIPFVENAFKHGIRLHTASFIKIRLYCDPTQVYFDVINSLHVLSGTQAEESGASGIGLDNVKKRLELLYDKRYSLHIHKDDSAFQVQLRIRLTEHSS